MFSLYSNPFSWLSNQSQKKVLWVFGILTLFMIVIMGIVGAPLKNIIAPAGIVTYELAGDLNQTQQILNSWDQPTKLYAALSLGIDYLFLVVYSIFLALLIFKISQFLSGSDGWFSKIGISLTWAQFLAAGFDVLENCALIFLLFGSTNKIYPPLAFYFASLKFLLVFLGIIYILIGLTALLIRKMK